GIAAGSARSERRTARDEAALLTDALSVDSLVDADGPLHVRRIDRQVVPARAFRGDDFHVAADAAGVDRLNDLAAAVAPAKDHFHRAGAGRGLVLRRPTDAKAAGVAGERLGLLVPAPGPGTHLMPEHHVFRSRWRWSLAGGAEQRCRDRDDYL